MADYIDRDAAIAETRKPRLTDAELRRRLAKIPAADVVPVRHGRWIDSDEPGVPSHCSCCGYPIDRFYKTKYCPNCGAKMDEEGKE